MVSPTAGLFRALQTDLSLQTEKQRPGALPGARSNDPGAQGGAGHPAHGCGKDRAHVRNRTLWRTLPTASTYHLQEFWPRVSYQRCCHNV